METIISKDDIIPFTRCLICDSVVSSPSDMASGQITLSEYIDSPHLTRRCFFICECCCDDMEMCYECEQKLKERTGICRVGLRGGTQVRYEQ